jgi:hypothetical protein
MLPTRDAERKQKLIDVCQTLPEVVVESWGADHLAFKVNQKTFAYYWNHHHGDDQIGFLCKAPAGEQDFLIRLDSQRFYKPAYVGVHGWVGVRLDLPDAIDWGEIESLARTAYKRTAPKRLLALLEGT